MKGTVLNLLQVLLLRQDVSRVLPSRGFPGTIEDTVVADSKLAGETLYPS